MVKKRSSRTTSTRPEPSASPGRTTRFAISCVLLVHLAIVVATPAGLVMPGSRFARWILQAFAPYVQAGNVSHGYAFFAPDPGPGHVIEYELRFADGREERGTIPDVQQHWPRLRYHRHFMLTEQLAALLQDEPTPPEDARFQRAWQQERAHWERQQRDFHQRAQAYGNHLLKTSGASEVEMHLLRHHLLTPEEFLSGRSLRDRALFETGEIITVRTGDQP